jgi:hypothetical protein
VLSVPLLRLPFVHCKEKDRQYNGQKKKTDNTMVKRKRLTIQQPKEKDRQHNGQKVNGEEGQTTQWPKGKRSRGTDNTMAKR